MVGNSQRYNAVRVSQYYVGVNQFGGRIMRCCQARKMRRRGNENYEEGGRDAAAGKVAVIGECAWGVCAHISCTGDADLLKCSCLWTG